MNFKLILGLLIATVFTIGAASAQTVYADFYTSEMADAGAPVPDSIGITENENFISITFHDLGGDGIFTYWNIPLSGGTHLTQSNDFYGEYRILTPSSLEDGGNPAKAHFGFINTGTLPSGIPPGGKIKNAFGAEFDSSATTTVLRTYLYDTDGNVLNAVGTEPISPETNYIIKISFNSATHMLTTTVTSVDDATEIDSVTLDIGASTFNVESMAAFSTYTLQGRSFLNGWYIWSGKANSGTTEHGQTICDGNQGDIILSTSSTGGGEDPVLTSQTGAKTIFVKTLNEDLIGSIDVNFDESLNDNDVVLPYLYVDTDGGDGKALMHHPSAWSTVPKKGVTPVVTNDLILVPWLGAGNEGYHCPNAAILDDITPACSGKTTGYTTIVSIGGTDYIQMPNQGGGNGGGAGVPEFSDIAYVLAAVLGAGSLLLIKRTRKGF